MQIFIHQTQQTIANFSDIFSYLEGLFESFTESNEKSEELHLFPELFLTGYPLQDLCLQQQFISKYLNLLDDIEELSKSYSKLAGKKRDITLLMGGLDYTFDDKGLPLTIKNVIYLLKPSKPLEVVYVKRLLPNYDIFDERKYFTPGDKCKIIDINGKHIALMICEDMWPSNFYKLDPGLELKALAKKEKKSLDLIVNLSASPFHLGKKEKRVTRASELSFMLDAPFIYVNRVGGEDEILFDGSSFVVKYDKLVKIGKLFEQDLLNLNFPLDQKIKKIAAHSPTKTDKNANTWEALFNPQLKKDHPSSTASLVPLTETECHVSLRAIQFGIQEYAAKTGFNNFLVALSGGIDSSLVLAIMKLILKKGQHLSAIFMPGHFTTPLSYNLAQILAQNLGVKLYNYPIKFLHSAISNSFGDSFNAPLQGLADENVQSRLRGTLLFARANQENSLVLNTSNKSELAVGYSTLYGDSVGAISMLGDLYKSEVYQLAKYFNLKYKHIIPNEIIDRPPTAELKDGQVDADTLPPYERLDAILECILSYRMDIETISRLGFDKTEVQNVFRLYTNSEYKRYQFCPIIKLKAKSFGFGHRVPICKSNTFCM